MHRIASQFRTTIKKEVGLQYLLRFPEFVSIKDGGVPLIVFLHGAGERSDSIDSIRNSCIANDGVMPDKYRGKIAVVSPVCPPDTQWEPDAVAALVKTLIKEWGIDENRVYCTGYSMGGRGTWDCATEYPNLFAAIAPMSGFSCYLKAARIAHVPSWIFHGRKDTTVPYEESTKMYQALREYGANTKLNYWQGGHLGWYGIYRDDNIYDWFLTHKKNAI